MEPKFNLNRPPISDEEINSNKDFGELVKKFKQQSIEKARSDVSFLKNKKATYFAIIAGVTVICTVTYFAVFKKQPPKENNNDKIVTTQKTNTTSTPSQNKQNKAFIAPPISKLNVPYTSYNVNADKGATITHKKSQSKIVIPKKAFVNKQGQDIVGDVEIRYREFHNQADIIASGIPMTYDSAGVQSHFESAGMIDITGYQNGEPVYINPNKQITVEFSSQYPDDKYNMYRLDTLARNWVYLSRDNSLKNQKNEKEKTKPAAQPHQQNQLTANGTIETPKTTELQKQIDAIPPKIETEKTVYTKKVNQLVKATAPVKPNKSVAGRPKFELDVNYKEFPELAAFKNAVFEVGAENKNYTSELSDITWSSAEVSEGPKKGENYVLTLKLRQRVEKLVVYPALTGADYEKAIKTYEAKFDEYKNLVAKREADEKKLKEEFEAKQAAYLAEQKRLNEELIKERVKYMQEQQQKLDEQFASMRSTERVVRVFEVSSFGIYNSDCPQSMPKGASVDPIFVLNGKTIVPQTVYMVCHNRNIVYNLQYGRLSYDPKETYSLCLITKGRTYLCNKQTFATATGNKQKNMAVSELSTDIDNVADFKKAIGI